MPGKVLISRVSKPLITTVTFTGVSGLGAVGTVAIGTVTGRIRIDSLGVACTTALSDDDNDDATVELGTANNTAAIIAQTTATAIDVNEFWKDTSPEVEVSDAVVNKTVQANIILTVATNPVVAGVLEFSFHWTPLSADGNLA